MNAPEIILAKRDGAALSESQIKYMIEGSLGSVPHSQVAAWLMAIYFKGMNTDETAHLTQAMIDSGTRLHLDPQQSPYIDKHSTGGVGDGVSLSLAPIVAACGVHVPMISGRALGHTGGTLDKLDAIPSYSTHLSVADFKHTVATVGYAMSGQTADLAPADKVLYALRDVTGTVESMPLIVSSILSKKIAEGANHLVMDIKCGNGAFLVHEKEARALATQLVATSSALGITTQAVLTRMEEPLGVMIGNFLEIEEAAVLLKGYTHNDYPDSLLRDIREVTYYLAVAMLTSAGTMDMAAAQKRVAQVVEDGSAWRLFCQNVAAQGGNCDALQQSFGNRAPCSHVVVAHKSGYISALPARAFGNAAIHLGVGRFTANDTVTPDAGIALHHKQGEYVQQGTPICTLYARTDTHIKNALLQLEGAITISEQSPPLPSTMIIDRVA